MTSDAKQPRPYFESTKGFARKLSTAIVGGTGEEIRVPAGGESTHEHLTLGLGTSLEQDSYQGNCQQWPALPKAPSPAAPRSGVTLTHAGGTHASAPSPRVLDGGGCPGDSRVKPSGVRAAQAGIQPRVCA